MKKGMMIVVVIAVVVVLFLLISSIGPLTGDVTNTPPGTTYDAMTDGNTWECEYEGDASRKLATQEKTTVTRSLKDGETVQVYESTCASSGAVKIYYCGTEGSVNSDVIPCDIRCDADLGHCI